MGSSFTTTIKTDIVVDSRDGKNSLTAVSTNDSKSFGNRYWQSLPSLDSTKCSKTLEDTTLSSTSDVLSLEQLASQPPILTPSWEIVKVRELGLTYFFERFQDQWIALF